MNDLKFKQNTETFEILEFSKDYMKLFRWLKFEIFVKKTLHNPKKALKLTYLM